MEAEQQQSQKTVVAFVSGLLIGALLMWVFGAEPKKDGPDEMKKDDAAGEVSTDTTADAGENTTDVAAADTAAEPTAEKPAMTVGAGSIQVGNQPAGKKVSIGNVTYPADGGWIAVHMMDGDTLGSVLGASRYGVKEGLAPSEVELLASTQAGNTYAVVFHTTDGDRTYSSKTDTVVMGADGKFLGSTFKAE